MKKQSNPSASELKEMAPSVMAYNAVILLIITALSFAFGFDWRYYTGLLAGNLLFIGNFLIIGITARSITHTRNSRRGQFLGNFSYGARYIGIFIILAVLLTFELVSPFTAVIPLFYPKLFYTVKAMRGRYDDFE